MYLLLPEIFHHIASARKDDMTEKSFIGKLLSRASSAEDITNLPLEIEGEVHRPELIPAPKLAVEHAHGVIERAISAHRAEEARLLDEINVRMEELRQVRVALDALGSAFVVLDADKANPARQPPLK